MKFRVHYRTREFDDHSMCGNESFGMREGCVEVEAPDEESVIGLFSGGDRLIDKIERISEENSTRKDSS